MSTTVHSGVIRGELVENRDLLLIYYNHKKDFKGKK